jgi:hypothetical protein
MVLTYHPEHRKITSNMSGYTKGCIEEFEQKNPSQKIKIVTTPATDIFFRTRKETDLEPMCKHRVAQFHSTIAKLLFSAKRMSGHITSSIIPNNSNENARHR